ncbi:uncharacterized protein ACR2FA_007807 [Aphomia sociella]
MLLHNQPQEGLCCSEVQSTSIRMKGKVRPNKPASLTPTAEPGERPPLPPPDPPPIPTEPFKSIEESNIFLDKAAFIPPKPISHSPKISPSSIPNPSPSVTTTKQVEPGYSNYSNYLYSIPGYSAFQPVSYPGIVQPNQAPLAQNENINKDFVPFPTISTNETSVNEEKTTEIKTPEISNTTPKVDIHKAQTDFEDHFTPEIIPAAPLSDIKSQVTECKMSITSLAQGSGATVTIPAQSSHIAQIVNSDNKKKTTERFSLKTSIPISKIDMKCVNNPPDAIFQNSLIKKLPTTSPFQNPKTENISRVEIQSNIVIKTAPKEIENKPEIKTVQTIPNNSISTLINAAEAINKTENQFRKPEPKEVNEVKDTPSTFTPQVSAAVTRPMFNPINIETSKASFSTKPSETSSYSEQKNQILFIQNKNSSNPKMLLTIQQQNPQVLLQRTNFDSKNMQAPSRLSSQTKKCKDDLANENSSSSKVVALKRLHQENCDENDFENLITENQIYGNKIVVKEKSQGTLQEQDLKNKTKNDKPTQGETKNVVLQPNFLYLSNVQFPANLMMIKNNTKVNATNDSNKINKIAPNENKSLQEAATTNTNEVNLTSKNTNSQTVSVSKEIHVLKSSNNVLQTLSNKNNKTDIVFQTNQKVIMNPQIVYQVPMIVDTDNKLNQSFVNRDYSKFISNKKEYSKQFDQVKQNDKLFIACPYQMDTKLQPKIVITNIRHKIAKIEEVSSLDIYEKRRRIRRLKYLSNRESKDQKSDTKRVQDKVDNLKNIITPDKMKAEIYKEFAKTRVTIDEDSSDSDNDFGEQELKEYSSIIKEYGNQRDDQTGKIEFLSNFSLATHDIFKEKELERQERILIKDSVASACVAAGRLDRLWNEDVPSEIYKRPYEIDIPNKSFECNIEKESPINLHRKQMFLNQLKLIQVSPQYKEGYERTWREIIKERNRRNGVQEVPKQFKTITEPLVLDPSSQLQLLTEIKNCVTENNNLIKKRLDSFSINGDGESIRVLAEKNFSELDRLSKMADRSVKIFSGQDTRKRDLNPGFDSENIQKRVFKYQQPFQSYPALNIPNISKIISLKSIPEQSTVTSTQATSMDEPKCSAAGVKEMFVDISSERTRDFNCQVDDASSWAGIEAVMKSYREFEAARRKEILELHRRNTSLRVDSAHITRSASRDSERARALLAERQNLAVEENNLRLSIQRLTATIELIRNY